VVTIAQKTIAFRIEEELHAQIRIQAIKEGKTMQEYVIELLKKDLELKAQKK
jgi:predicted HicB family RNase H-like nuclease